MCLFFEGTLAKRKRFLAGFTGKPKRKQTISVFLFFFVGGGPIQNLRLSHMAQIV